MNPSLCAPRPNNLRCLEKAWTSEEPMLAPLYEQVLALYEEIADFEKSVDTLF